MSVCHDLMILVRTKNTTGVKVAAIIKTTNKLSTEVRKVEGDGTVTGTIGGADNSKEVSVCGTVYRITLTGDNRSDHSTGESLDIAGWYRKTQKGAAAFSEAGVTARR